MSIRIATFTGNGRIVDESDNAHVIVIEFHARSDNSGNVYVGGSDVTTINGREIVPGDSYVLNLSLPDVARHAGRVLLSSFYALCPGGDSVDWSAIIRDPAA